MYESREPVTETDPAAAAAGVVAWLGARDQVERELRDAVGGQASHRDDTLARMADVLQATAHGLGQEAAAVWAGVPVRVLESWLRRDPAFASAVRSAAALSAAHGLRPGGEATPAMVRVVIAALGQGVTWPAAARAAGLTPYRLRQLWKASPVLVALVDAARRTRPRKSKGYVPAAYWPRRAGWAANAYNYRLVQLDDPALPVPHAQDT
ncbi:hypothetical protein ACFV0T_02465 [Streptomyces sp. NPDC059582]|uniref:hypothetical protein n=1 Tax=Streptomyces sp. NPDC059582 TaxID=3346875 RepID=UPI0036CAD830